MGIKSNALRQSARDQACTFQIPKICNHNKETTVLAHIQTEGGIMGGKADDFSAAFACFSCHVHLDQHKMRYEDELFFTRRAMVRTIAYWVEQGLISVKGNQNDR
jgi:hypothetical protein|tara:strand:+ start:281 stop:595 length:315 start_codon:yes stop_codon:yes gene_type:complete